MFTISISGVIGWDVTPRQIRAELKDGTGDLLVEIASPGGFVFDGLEIFNLLKDYSGGTVTIKLMGIAASMASVIALAGDRIIAHDTAVFMIHNAKNIVYGNHIDMREMADHLEKVSNHLAKIYVKKTGKTLNEIKKLLDADNGSGTYLFGEEMVEAGFVDEIIETESDDKDKDSAIIDAMLKVENCVDFLQKSDEGKEDLSRAAACVGGVPSITNVVDKNNQTLQTPEKPEIKINKKEVNTMDELNKYLAENPEAKKAHDEMIAAASKEGAGVINARIESAKNYLNNKDYPTLGALALEVVTGKTDLVALTAAVTAIDALIGKKQSDAAAGDTDADGDTVPEPDPVEKDTGECETVADVDAEIKRIKDNA